MQRTVLIADDEEPVRLAMRRLLVSAFGCHVLEAEDGLSALKLLSEHQDVAMAVLDLTMPVVSGLEVLDIIRQSEAHKSLPVLIFTGTHDEESAQHAIEAGVNDFLLKPFRLAQIRPRIERLLSQPRQVEAPATSALLHTGPVLVVDGSGDFQHLVKTALGVMHEVVGASTGLAALEECRSQSPFAVLVGAQTGLLGGEMLARKIRDTGCKDTVVIQVNENDSDALAPCFDAALTRTYMPTVFADAFRRCCETRFSMIVDTPVFTLLRTCARSAAQQAMGMLAQTDVSVSVLPAEHHADANLDVVTRVTLTMWKGTMAVDMELRCTQGTATQTAASLLGVGADTVTAEDAQSSLGELANIVAGRIQSVVAKEYGPAKFTIPTTGTGSTETGFRAQFGLRAAAKNSDAFVDLLMSARPLRPGAREVRAA